nr:MAG TPA: hypothetical protein [Caudoviricetes sp.]
MNLNQDNYYKYFKLEKDMKTLTVRQFATVKRVAQNVNFLVTKKNKVAAEIERLNKEYNDLVNEIDGHEVGVRALTGHTSEELVTKIVETTEKMDKDGRPIKVTKYEPKAGMVVFNEDTRVYEIHDEEEEVSGEVPAESIDDSEKAPEVEGPSDFILFV